MNGKLHKKHWLKLNILQEFYNDLLCILHNKMVKMI